LGRRGGHGSIIGEVSSHTMAKIALIPVF
jgi:hypothetical protein